MWRDDNERLEAFRSRNSAFAFIDAILAAMEYARSVGRRRRARRPGPNRPIIVDDRLELTDRRPRPRADRHAGRRDVRLDGRVAARESRTLFSGNLFGPLFGHVPNLVTIRGDRYRDALDLHRLARRGARARTRAAGHRATSTRSSAPTASPRRSRAAGGDAVGARPHRRRHERRDRRAHAHARGAGARAPRRRARATARPSGTSGPSGRTTPAGSTTDPPPSSTACRPSPSRRTSWPPPAPTRWSPRPAAHLDGRPTRWRHCSSPTSCWPSSPTDAAASAVAARATTGSLLDATTNFWERAWLRRSLDKLGASMTNQVTFDFSGARVAGHRRDQRHRPRHRLRVRRSGRRRDRHRDPARRPRTTTRTSPGSPTGSCRSPTPTRSTRWSRRSTCSTCWSTTPGANLPGGLDEWDPEGFAASVALNLVGPMRLTVGCRKLLFASELPGGASVVNMASMSAFRAATDGARLRVGQGRHRDADRQPRPQVGGPGRPRQRGRPRRDRHADDGADGGLPGAAGRGAGPHPDGSARHGRTRSSAPRCSSCSSAASYLTGHTVAVDGGYLAG